MTSSEVPARCALDDEGAALQGARYAHVAQVARRVERRGRTLSVEMSEGVDESIVRELIAVERRCCPFFDLRYEQDAKRLLVSVDEAHERALDAIAHAVARASAPA